MPGVVKSIAYFALPSTFDGMSRRPGEVRRMVKRSALLSPGLVGTGCVAAERASSPNVALRPDAACATREAFARLGLDLIPGSGVLPACVPGSFDAWMLLARDCHRDSDKSEQGEHGREQPHAASASLIALSSSSARASPKI